MSANTAITTVPLLVPRSEEVPRFVPEERFLQSQRAVGALVRDRQVAMNALRACVFCLDYYRRIMPDYKFPPDTETSYREARELLSAFDGIPDALEVARIRQEQDALAAAECGPPRTYHSGLSNAAERPA